MIWAALRIDWRHQELPSHWCHPAAARLLHASAARKEFTIGTGMYIKCQKVLTNHLKNIQEHD